MADRSSRVTDDDVLMELERRLRQQKERGQFAAVHASPDASADVPDEADARLVILSPRHTVRRGAKDEAAATAAIEAAQDILDNRGSVPRRLLVFAAADDDVVQSLLTEARRHLAWKSIVADVTALGLDKAQERQAREMEEQTDRTVTAQRDEAYKYLPAAAGRCDGQPARLMHLY